MQVRFFVKEDGSLDGNAIKGGVYHVELLKENNDKRISLYIGESAHIAARCGKHLFKVFEEASYFGLRDEDLIDDSLILEFSVLKPINENKPKMTIKNPYKDSEKNCIRDYNPLTQLSTSDRQKKKDIRLNTVQEKMIKYKFK